MNRKLWFRTVMDGKEIMINADHCLSISPDPNDPFKTWMQMTNETYVVDESYDTIKSQLTNAFLEGY